MTAPAALIIIATICTVLAVSIIVRLFEATLNTADDAYAEVTDDHHPPTLFAVETQGI